MQASRIEPRRTGAAPSAILLGRARALAWEVRPSDIRNRDGAPGQRNRHHTSGTQDAGCGTGGTERPQSARNPVCESLDGMNRFWRASEGVGRGAPIVTCISGSRSNPVGTSRSQLQGRTDWSEPVAIADGPHLNLGATISGDEHLCEGSRT